MKTYLCSKIVEMNCGGFEAAAQNSAWCPRGSLSKEKLLQQLGAGREEGGRGARTRWGAAAGLEGTCPGAARVAATPGRWVGLTAWDYALAVTQLSKRRQRALPGGRQTVAESGSARVDTSRLKTLAPAQHEEGAIRPLACSARGLRRPAAHILKASAFEDR